MGKIRHTDFPFSCTLFLPGCIGSPGSILYQFLPFYGYLPLFAHQHGRPKAYRLQLHLFKFLFQTLKHILYCLFCSQVSVKDLGPDISAFLEQKPSSNHHRSEHCFEGVHTISGLLSMI